MHVRVQMLGSILARTPEDARIGLFKKPMDRTVQRSTIEDLWVSAGGQ